MAEASSSTMGVEEETGLCPVCLEEYQEPKMLGCGHTLCRPCTDRITRGGVQSLDSIREPFYSRSRSERPLCCPICRKVTQVPASGLPTNYTLQEVLRRFNRVLGEKEATSSRKKWRLCVLCQEQSPEEAFWHCAACLDAPSWVCAHCALKYHNGHNLQSLAEVGAQRDALQRRLTDVVTTNKTDLSNTRLAVNALAESILQNVEIIKGTVEEQAEAMKLPEMVGPGDLRLYHHRLHNLGDKSARAVALYNTAIAEADARLKEGLHSVLEALATDTPLPTMEAADSTTATTTIPAKRPVTEASGSGIMEETGPADSGVFQFSSPTVLTRLPTKLPNNPKAKRKTHRPKE